MTESFFYLKTLTLKRSDSTEPAVSNMETGEVSQDDEETFASQFGLGKKKTKSYPFRQCLFAHWFKIFLTALVLGVIVGLVLVDIRTNRSLDSTEMKVSELKSVIKGDEKSINNLITNIDILTIKSQIVVIKNELKEVKDENVKLSSNITNMAEELRKSNQKSKDMFSIFFKESNITLCSKDGNKVISPVGGIFKLEITARAKGGLYADENIFKIKKNNNLLAGGIVKVSKKEMVKDNLVKCFPSDPRNVLDCVVVDHVMIVKLDEGDEIAAIEEDRHAGRVVKTNICLQKTELQIPDGLESVIITH